jgi:hypothetical protein
LPAIPDNRKRDKTSPSARLIFQKIENAALARSRAQPAKNCTTRRTKWWVKKQDALEAIEAMEA